MRIPLYVFICAKGYRATCIPFGTEKPRFVSIFKRRLHTLLSVAYPTFDHFSRRASLRVSKAHIEHVTNLSGCECGSIENGVSLKFHILLRIPTGVL